MSANCEVDDFAQAGVAHSMVGTGAKFLGQAHARIEEGRAAFFGDGLVGADLDTDVAQLPGFSPRLGPTAAAGSVMEFTRSSSSGALQVAAGVVVASLDDESVRFITTEDFTFADGYATYPQEGGTPVRVVCLSRGRVGNIAVSVIGRVVDAPPEVIGCSNLVSLTNGLDRESDASLRQRRNDFIAGLQGYTDSFYEYLAKSFVSPTEGTRFTHASARTSPTTPGLVELYVDDGEGVGGSQIPAFSTSGVVPDNGQRVFWFHGPAATDPTVTYDGVDYPMSEAAAKANFVIRHEHGEGVVLPEATLFQTSGRVWTVQGHKVFVGPVAEFQAQLNGMASDPLNFPGKRLSGLRVRAMVPRVEYVAFVIRLTISAGEVWSDVFQRVRDGITSFARGLGIEEMLKLAYCEAAQLTVPGVDNIRILSPTDDYHPGPGARVGTRPGLITLEVG